MHTARESKLSGFQEISIRLIQQPFDFVLLAYSVEATSYQRIASLTNLPDSFLCLQILRLGTNRNFSNRPGHIFRNMNTFAHKRK